MEKFQPERFVVNEAKDLSREQLLEQEAGRVLAQALQDTAGILHDSPSAAEDPETREQIKTLQKEASSALATLYKKMKSVGKTSSKLLLFIGLLKLSGYATDKAAGALLQKDLPPVQHIDRNKLPLALEIVDTFVSSDVSSDLIDTHNKCVDFLKKRKNGKMSKEEILFKEKIARNIAPFGYRMDIASNVAS